MVILIGSGTGVDIDIFEVASVLAENRFKVPVNALEDLDHSRELDGK